MKNTSYIAFISYRIEQWIHDGAGIEVVRKRLEGAVKNKHFIDGLSLVDAYVDEKYGSSGCAFNIEGTSEVILGFAGTNYRSGALEIMKDVFADAVMLGVTGMEPGCEYLHKAEEFTESIKEKGYKISTATGHSLGGALAMYIAIYHDVPKVMTYNSAPLYVVPLGDKSAINERVKAYSGEIIRYISDNDPLTGISETASAFYPGRPVRIADVEGHAMDNFIFRDTEQES